MPARNASTVVVAGSLIAIAAVAAYLGADNGDRLQFQELEVPAGFRKLVAEGGQSKPGAAFDPLFGLEVREQRETAPALDLCDALFDQPGDPSIGPDNAAVTVVEFTDYQCPYCRVVARILPEVVAEQSDVRVVYKEWPIFGEQSELAARAAIAASRQGKHAPFHARLMGSSLLPSEALIADISEAIGADTQRLMDDLQDAAIHSALDRNASLARQLGFRGTPSFVVGRTLAEGALTRTELETLIAAERSASADNPCA